MARNAARLFGTAAIVVLLRSYLLLIVWSVAGVLLVGRFMLMTIGGGIIMLATLGFFFWGLIGLVGSSGHALLLAASMIPLAILGVAIAGLSNGSLLRAVQQRVAAMQAEDAAKGAAGRPPHPVRLLPRP